MANDFDMTPSEMPALEGIGAGRQPVGRVELEEAIDLVHEQVARRPRPAIATRPSNVARSGSIPVGLCGALTTMSRVAGVTWRAEQIEVDRPAGVLAQLVERHVGAGGPGDLVQALVAGPRHDRVIARPEQRR